MSTFISETSGIKIECIVSDHSSDVAYKITLKKGDTKLLFEVARKYNLLISQVVNPNLPPGAKGNCYTWVLRSSRGA